MACSSSTVGWDKALPCFFCLQSPVVNKLSTKETNRNRNRGHTGVASWSCHEFSLRDIYRFLSSHSRQVHDLEKEEEMFNNAQLSLSACEDCSKLTSEFSELFNLLEEIKMRLNWNIKKLEDVMTKAEKKSQSGVPLKMKVKAKRGRMEDGRTILGRMRAETIDRMKEITQLPDFQKVKRKRPLSTFLQNYLQTKEDETKRLRTNDNASDQLELAATKDKARSSRKQSSVAVIANHRESRTNVMEQDHESGILLGNDPMITMEVFPDIHTIMVCKSEDGDNEMKPKLELCGGMNMVQDMQFEESRPFPQIINVFKIENEETVHSNISNPGGSPDFMSNFIPAASNKAKLCCKLCTKTLNPENASAHWNFFCPKGLQRPTISKKIDNLSPSLPPKWRCSICNFACAANINGLWSSKEMHQVRFHPEQYFPKEMGRASAMTLTLEQFQGILQDRLFPEFIINTGDIALPLSCALCGTQFESKNAFDNIVLMQKHLICKHKTELKGRLEVMLEDPLLEDGLRNE